MTFSRFIFHFDIFLFSAEYLLSLALFFFIFIFFRPSDERFIETGLREIEFSFLSILQPFSRWDERCLRLSDSHFFSHRELFDERLHLSLFSDDSWDFLHCLEMSFLSFPSRSDEPGFQRLFHEVSQVDYLLIFCLIFFCFSGLFSNSSFWFSVYLLCWFLSSFDFAFIVVFIISLIYCLFFLLSLAFDWSSSSLLSFLIFLFIIFIFFAAFSIEVYLPFDDDFIYWYFSDDFSDFSSSFFSSFSLSFFISFFDYLSLIAEISFFIRLIIDFDYDFYFDAIILIDFSFWFIFYLHFMIFDFIFAFWFFSDSWFFFDFLEIYIRRAKYYIEREIIFWIFIFTESIFIFIERCRLTLISSSLFFIFFFRFLLSTFSIFFWCLIFFFFIDIFIV